MAIGNNIPLGIEVAVRNGVQAAMEMERIAKSTKSVDTAFSGLSSRLAGFAGGIFSVGTVASFAKSSFAYLGSLMDFTDQFGVSASQAQGFVREIRNVGGSSQKAMSIFQQLQAAQEKAGDARPLREFIEEIRTSYLETGNFGQIIDLVGSKNAPVFAAALKNMTGGLEALSNSAIDTGARLADELGEQLESAGERAKTNFAIMGGVYITYLKSLKDGAVSLFKGGSPTKAVEDFVKTLATPLAKTVALSKQKEQAEKDALQAATISKASRAFFVDKFAEEIANADQQAAINQLIAEYMQPSNFVGPLDPTKSNFYDMIKRKKEKGLGALNFSEAMSSGSSAAIVAFQKFRQGGASTIESEQLRIQKQIERNTRDAAKDAQSITINVIDEP